MRAPLLQAKLYVPPARSDVLPRPQLIERLNAGLGWEEVFTRKLTLLSAPAGFRTTTLLTQWAADCRWPVAN